MNIDPATVIAAMIGRPPDQPALVVDRVKRLAAMEQRATQEFRMPVATRRVAVAQAPTPPPRGGEPCPRCAMVSQCVCPKQ